MVKIEYGHGSGGQPYCKNMGELLIEAENKDLTRSDIARIAEVDISTVRNWFNP
jgi:hypothetical protein